MSLLRHKENSESLRKSREKEAIPPGTPVYLHHKAAKREGWEGMEVGALSRTWLCQGKHRDLPLRTGSKEMNRSV